MGRLVGFLLAQVVIFIGTQHVIARPPCSNENCTEFRPPTQAALGNNCFTPVHAPMFNALGYGNCDSWRLNTWAPKRQPGAFIQFYDPGDQWTSNPRALQQWWYCSPTHGASPTDEIADTRKYFTDPNDPTPYIDEPNNIPDQIEEMVHRMDVYYTMGFRRIILQFPAGVAFGRPWKDSPTGPTYYIGQDISMNQWYGLSTWKRAWFTNEDGPFQTWLRQHTDCAVELYTGAPISHDACTMCMNESSIPPIGNDYSPRLMNVPVKIGNNIEFRFRWTTPCLDIPAARDFDPRVQSHCDAVVEAVVPWAKIGVKGFWLDASNGSYNYAANNVPWTHGYTRRWGHTELTYNPELGANGIYFGGEALPDLHGDAEQLDMCAIESSRWMALQSQVMHSNGTLRNWTFNRNKTEVHILPANNSFTFRHFVEARNRGYVMTIFNLNDNWGEIMKRIYSMGVIYIADFNGDGVVNLQDKTDYLWAISQPTSLKVYVTGDINGDGQIDSSDDTLFNTAWNWGVANPGQTHPAYVIDFKVADDL